MAKNGNVLIVDDNQINRAILRKQLSDMYQITEASNGQEALDMLMSDENPIKVILLDLMMPVMNGYEFLEEKRKHDHLRNVPVIIMTGHDTMRTQMRAMELGANDFMTTPYEPDLIKLRIQNVVQMIESREKAKRDQMTKLLNRVTFENVVTTGLHLIEPEKLSAFLLLDIDDFKLVNDTLGHATGDEVLRYVARMLRSLFRATDVIGRIGGDEFAVFITNIPDEIFAYKRGLAICEEIRKWVYPGSDLELSCSVGIALSPKNSQVFETLYECADQALYQSKENGKDQCTVYGMTIEELGGIQSADRRVREQYTRGVSHRQGLYAKTRKLLDENPGVTYELHYDEHDKFLDCVKAGETSPETEKVYKIYQVRKK